MTAVGVIGMHVPAASAFVALTSASLLPQAVSATMGEHQRDRATMQRDQTIRVDRDLGLIGTSSDERVLERRKAADSNDAERGGRALTSRDVPAESVGDEATIR